MGNRQLAKGFTLIELMVVVAIIGLLAVVAIPGYRDSVRKSNRADAQIMLSRLATLEERYFFRSNQYTDDFADLVPGATSGLPLASDGGHYSIALSLTGGGSGWSMTATAVGNQAADSACASLTLNSLGNKTALNAGGTASSECW
ncbi:MAG: type IV pilin protein [Pseudomonadales bacterium]|nr:type IV pilin protein [Pseudomonadales bacterium]